jgi:hypothetical protein
MVQTVNVKGHGSFDFPDGMSQEQIGAVLREKFPPTQAPQTQQVAPTATPAQPAEAQDPLANVPALLRLPMDLAASVASGGAGDTLEEFGEAAMSRPTFRAAGGTAGGALGIPAGLAGVLGGGALGSAAGDALFNVVEALRGGEAPETVLEAFKSPLEAAKEDIMFGGALTAGGRALSGIPKVIGKGLTEIAGGFTPEAKELTKMASEKGVELSTLAATPREATKGAARVMGVFPFIGTPIREGQKTAIKQSEKALDDTLNKLAPTATIAKTGSDLSKAGTSRFKAFRRLAGRLYDGFEEKAKNLSKKDIFPSAPVKGTVQDIFDEAGTITLESGEQLKGFGDETVDNFLRQLNELPENLTVEQVRSLQTDLQNVLGKAKTTGFDTSKALDVKASLETSLSNPNTAGLGDLEAEELVSSLKVANRFFSDNMSKFDTATAKKFGRVDKNVFKPKFFKSGSLEEDEAFKVLFNSKSPEAIKNLKQVVKGKPYNQAVRRHLDNLVEKSMVGNAEDPTRFISGEALSKNLGLGTKSGKETLSEMLKGTDVSVKDVDEVVKILKAVESVEIPEVSKFIQRRAMLGGAQSVATLFALGGAASGVGLPAKVLGMASARTVSKMLGDPKFLKDMKTIVSKTASDLAKEQAISRAIVAASEEENANAIEER